MARVRPPSLLEEGAQYVSMRDLAAALNRDRSAVSRRAKEAMQGEYLSNGESRLGRISQLRLGLPLPDDQVILPAPSDLDLCSAAGVAEGTGSHTGVRRGVLRDGYPKTGASIGARNLSSWGRLW